MNLIQDILKFAFNTAFKNLSTTNQFKNYLFGRVYNILTMFT